MKNKVILCVIAIVFTFVGIVSADGLYERFYEHIDNEGTSITFSQTIGEIVIRNDGDYPVYCEFNKPMNSTLSLNEKIDDGEVYADDITRLNKLYLKCNDGETTDVFIRGSKN